ncbi:helix-turn-helix domain containing protein [Kaistia defluvii]|uniref:TetR/AcrR family transcriptional regulator n=1 Tax=Kaistia defluvii TaxID=410841 RepID=UPI0022597DF0|nr:TetR/AcrR family transcriptional regulator [Kaistia defluvii]MCX5520270.1 helix-turn-helix domain containing protein [Kaistia defluvii]
MTQETRTRIVEAAETLFYEHGLRSVSVDAIAERAGVTKRTLYYHFYSKDALIAAYLEMRDRSTVERYRGWLGRPALSMPERIVMMFAALADHAGKPRWRGCGFTRAAVELAGQPGHPAVQMAAKHKRRFEAWLEQEFRSGGMAEPQRLARQVALLIEGAIAQMLIHGDVSYAVAAGEAAATLASGDAGHLRRASQPTGPAGEPMYTD